MRALSYIAASAVLIVLAFLSYRAGSTWGAFTFGSLLFLLFFGEDIVHGPAVAPPAPDALDPWRPFPPSLGDPLPLPVAPNPVGAFEAGADATLAER